jgi:hypothetical protein
VFLHLAVWRSLRPFEQRLYAFLQAQRAVSGGIYFFLAAPDRFTLGLRERRLDPLRRDRARSADEHRQARQMRSRRRPAGRARRCPASSADVWTANLRATLVHETAQSPTRTPDPGVRPPK